MAELSRAALATAAAELRAELPRLDRAVAELALVGPLVQAGLELRAIRPRILSDDSVDALKRYLAFRHRFRDLYLYELHVEPVVPLTEDAPAVWADVRAELSAFAEVLEKLAETLP